MLFKARHYWTLELLQNIYSELKISAHILNNTALIKPTFYRLEQHQLYIPRCKESRKVNR